MMTKETYIVLEAGYHGERVVYETDDENSANAVAEQKVGRRVVVREGLRPTTVFW